jgi:hypothetical protein
MKIIASLIAIILFSFVSPQASNPLQNTRWEDPNGLVVFFTRSDTVKIIMDNKVLAAAQYKVRDSLVIWRDFIKSPSTCDTSIRGTYVYIIKDSLLTLKVVSDRCEERANILQTLILARDE